MFMLPYLSQPPSLAPGSPTAALSAWVGLDGIGATQSTLFQACLNFNLESSTDPPSFFFNTPTWQWWIPTSDPYASTNFGGGTIMNAPPVGPGDVVQLYCAYVSMSDGTLWGTVQFLFWGRPPVTTLSPDGYPEGGPWHMPIVISSTFPGPPGLGAAGAINGASIGASVEWILENESVTNGLAGTTLPVFSGEADALTSIGFTQCVGFGQSANPPAEYFGDPIYGDAVLFSEGDGDSVAVTLDYGTVAIAYTG